MLCAIFPMIAKEVDQSDRVTQVKLGNFALPISQQVGPLIGFGQNVLDKHDLQLFTRVSHLSGDRRKFMEVAPSVLYGIKNNLSLFVELPIFIKTELDDHRSRGVRDLLVQFEYAFYDKDTFTTGDTLTFVGNVTLPTGSPFKAPPTGFGAPSVFLGGTASHVTVDWYFFIAGAGIFPLRINGERFGNTYLYQAGISRNISYVSEEWMLAWMIELDGVYRQRNSSEGRLAFDLGSHELLLGPSLWFSTQRFIVQAGISWFVWQHQFGQLNNGNYFAECNVGWKF